MFERFTDQARRVVALAQDEARMLNHNYIGTEHIILGLSRIGEGVAVRALDSLGIELVDVRRRVENRAGRGPQTPCGHIPFTPQAKKVLALALRETLLLGHNYIGTEHILLGLIREGEGVAAQVLVRLGADLNRVRQQVLCLLAGQVVERPVPQVAWREPLAAIGKRMRVRSMPTSRRWQYEVITPGAKPVTVTGLCSTWQEAMRTAEAILRVAHT